MARSKFFGAFAGLLAVVALAASSFFSTGGLANAADAIVFEVPAAPVEIIADSKNFEGVYLGGLVTYGKGSIHDVSNDSAAKQKPDGIMGGVTLGYNYVFDNNVMLGAEVDQSFGSMSAKWGGQHKHDPYYGKDSIGNLGTARARLGYVYGDWMPYVTGGLAWADLKNSLGCDAGRVASTTGCQNKVSQFDTSHSGYKAGYALGAGVEYAVNKNWSVKTEYMYANFGKNKVTLNDPNWPAASERNFKTDLHTVRLGVNYRF